MAITRARLTVNGVRTRLGTVAPVGSEQAGGKLSQLRLRVAPSGRTDAGSRTESPATRLSIAAAPIGASS